MGCDPVIDIAKFVANTFIIGPSFKFNITRNLGIEVTVLAAVIILWST